MLILYNLPNVSYFLLCMIKSGYLFFMSSVVFEKIDPYICINPDHLHEWNYKDLQKLCARLGLGGRGKKVELVAKFAIFFCYVFGMLMAIFVHPCFLFILGYSTGIEVVKYLVNMP